MAETAVSFVVERLGDLLIEQVVFLKGVRGQVERLRDQLVRMKCFLKDADESQDDDARIRNWISQIRVAAYDTEDVIETFIIKVESLNRKKLFPKLVYFPKRLFCLYKVGKDIESIQARIRDIADSRETFGTKNLGGGSSTRGEELQRLRRSSPLIEDKGIVGLEEQTSSLVAELLKGEKRRCVVSIIGMGGVGKTTLARKVYNHADVRAQFYCRAWVCISQNYQYKDILGSVIKQVKSPTKELLEMLEKMQEQDLEQMLHRELANKCYLVVLDDIWKEEAWDCLARAFPYGSNGSRLLLTSRNQDVPLRADSRSIPYELKSLGQEDSWELFVKKACSDSDNPRCPSELEGIGREIARRCAGLPLAITVIGGLLGRKKKLKSEWERVLNNISSHLSRNQTGVSTILALSYSDLPPHLKSCFLYFGLFPEDYAIPSRKLIHIWIAEGLIQQRETEHLEGLAADHLDDLICRNMVQVASVSADERVKSCRIHDLLRDLAIEKAKEEIFLEIHGVRDTQTSANCRHCAVHCHSANYNFSAHSTPHLRSLLFFRLGDAAPEVRLSFKSFKLLRVLDLEGMDVITLPNEVGNVILLRYLGLRHTKITKLPQSLGQLQSLQTLDIVTFPRIEVPNVIWKLENLRHLYMSSKRLNGALKIETLRNLQTLSCIHVDHLLRNNLLSLTNLQKLGVIVHTEAEVENLSNSIAKLGNLRSLCLRLVGTVSSFVGLSNLSQLTKLKIEGRLKMIPSPDQFPPNLSHFCLSVLGLDEDPMPVLEKFEQLSVLKLGINYRGTKMMISENSFPKLKYLGLKNLGNLKEMSVGKGAMPELRCLRIIGCYELKMLPEEVKNMKALVRLEIMGAGRAFTAKLQSVDAYKPSMLGCYELKMFPEMVKNMTALEKLEITGVRRAFTAKLQSVDAYKVRHVPNVILEDFHDLREKIRVGQQAYAAALLFTDAGAPART